MQLNEGILIVNFGSQYTQLIARRVREIGVYTEVCNPEKVPDILVTQLPKGIILSGGPASIYEKNAPTLNVSKIIKEYSLPILGICYGMQLIAQQLGGDVSAGKIREYGQGKVRFHTGHSCAILENLPEEASVLLSHGDEVKSCPRDFLILGESMPNNVIAMIAHKEQSLYGVQFHPETTHSPCGTQLLKNFAYNICKCTPTWQTPAILTHSIAQIRKEVGSEEKVILGLSGGVDSSVAAVLLHQAIGDRLTCIFIDSGLLRKNEAQDILRIYKENFQLNICHVAAGHIFLAALQGIQDPEEKRKVIGKVFIEIFEKEARNIEGATFLAQGTIYPDRIESMGMQAIKSHHNVGGLPEKMHLKIIEPIKNLFKDEVRALGKELLLPETILNRHPFPGPGLAVRITGEVTETRLNLLKEADAILIEALKKHQLYNEVSQAFVVLLPLRSVGVMGDKRTYEYTCVVRCVHTIDFMSASWSRLPYDFLDEVSTRIVGEVKGINRVVYDISHKPPATIEWE